MPFSEAEKREIRGRCTRFLSHGPPGPVSERLRQMADSEYAKSIQDFYGSGGFLADFEAEVAALLGHEEAVFMPSGTMAQQIALRIWCDRAGNPNVAFHPTCHLEIHEQGAYRVLHHLCAQLVGGKDRLFTLRDLEALTVKPAALLIELPQREIGGQLPNWDELSAICDWARHKGIKLHLDGARLWECRPFYDRSYAEIAGLFDSVYVSCYKILGGLPGAMLAGPTELIGEAKIWQRRHGGNLHTLAPNAIAAKMGLEQRLPRVPLYCSKAAEIAATIGDIPGLTLVPEPPPTNMMHLHFTGNLAAMEDAVWQISRDTGTFLFASFDKTECEGVGKVEVSIHEPGLELDPKEIRELMARILVAGGVGVNA